MFLYFELNQPLPLTLLTLPATVWALPGDEVYVWPDVTLRGWALAVPAFVLWQDDWMPAHLVEIAVADRGIGIPSRDLERIFERFYRVDRARSRETGGTGLGLAIVRHVADKHQGRVLVESKLGSGSIFTLQLPVRSTDVTDPA